MDWSNERYIRVYTRDTIEWNMMPWQSRALFPLLCRKVDRSGVIDPGKHGVRGLAITVGLPEDVTAAGLAGLLDDGCVIQNGTVLVIRNFLEAQEATKSDAARAKEYRNRRRDAAVTKRDDAVTNRDDTVTPVTTTVTSQPDRHSVPSVPIRAVPSEPPDPAQIARARVDGDKLRQAWSRSFPGQANVSPLLEVLRTLTPEQAPVGVEELFTAAAVKYRAAYLEHKRVKIPADPARLAEPKHFGNIVEVMLGTFDVGMLDERKPGGKATTSQPSPSGRRMAVWDSTVPADPALRPGPVHADGTTCYSDCDREDCDTWRAKEKAYFRSQLREGQRS